MAEPGALQQGLVVASHGRHCWVEDAHGVRRLCHPRGKKNQVVVGDRVLWLPAPGQGQEGSIEQVLPRRNLLYRQDELRSKSFAANLDQVLILIAAEPVFSESQLARALIAAEAAQIRPLIVLNKSDLAEPFARAWERLLPYRTMKDPDAQGEGGAPRYSVLPLSLATQSPEAVRALLMPYLGACRPLGVESENAPQRGQFLPDSPPHSGTMGQEDGKKWAAAAHSQPTIPKSDRLPEGRTTLVLGPSGAGKSTLVNLLVPGARALTGEISQALNSGKHTTTSTTWYWIDGDGCGDGERRTALIDSPGFQEFGLQHIAPMQLAACMPDIAAHARACKFYNCTHLHEPGCGVLQAVGQAGPYGISVSRYKIYKDLFAELSRRRRY